MIQQEIKSASAYETKKPLSMSTDNLLGDLTDFNWQNVINQFRDKAPMLVAVILGETNTNINNMCNVSEMLWINFYQMNFQTISGALTNNRKGYRNMKNRSKSVLPLLGSIISQIMYCQKNDNNAFQVCNSLLMWLSGCKRTVSIVCVYKHIKRC